MSITLICGPMFAGKTSNFLYQIERNVIAKKQCIIVKHADDTRYSANEKIITHGGIIWDKCEIIISGDLASIFEKLQKYQVVGLSEAQFYPDLVSVATRLADTGIHIIAEGLNGDFRQQNFEQISALIPHCDHIRLLRAVCMGCGKNAQYSARKSLENEQKIIGGADKYTVLCRQCLHARE